MKIEVLEPKEIKIPNKGVYITKILIDYQNDNILYNILLCIKKMKTKSNLYLFLTDQIYSSNIKISKGTLISFKNQEGGFHDLEKNPKKFFKYFLLETMKNSCYDDSMELRQLYFLSRADDIKLRLEENSILILE